MIQAPQPEGPHYAIRLLGGVAAGTRLARASQSETAAALLEDLRRSCGIVSAWSSKAHSRAMAAAAVSQFGAVGIDIEYEAPERDIRAVASLLLGAQVAEAAAGYRLFTFREAYFKATGEWPARPLLNEAAGAVAPYRTSDGLSVLHQRPAEGFVLCLVWAGGGLPVRHELPEHAEGRL